MVINQARTPGLNYFRRGIDPDSGIRGKRMNEVTALIAEIKSKGLLRAGDKLEELYSVAASIQADNVELKVQRDALAAENAALKIFINQSCYSYDGDGSDVCDSYVGADESPFFPKTPATDAYLNSVRAEGVEMAADCLKLKNTVGSTGAMAYMLNTMAFELRAGKDGE